MIGLKRVLSKMKKQRKAFSLGMLLVLTCAFLAFNVNFSNADGGIPLGTRNADGDITYDGVVYDHTDIKYSWDISENVSGGKIFAYYFRNNEDPTKYDGGTVIIMDIDPSGNPTSPNRLMTFNKNVYFTGSKIQYEYGSDITTSSNYGDFDNHRVNNSSYVATPYSVMSEANLLNGGDDVVYKLIVANKVHSGKDMNNLFSSLRRCKEFDLRNLQVDYEYMIDNHENSDIYEYLFLYDNDCTIKMFDNSNYLEDSFYRYSDLEQDVFGGITFDFSDVNMDFDPAHIGDFDGAFSGVWNPNRIYVPKTLNVPSGEKILFTDYLSNADDYTVWNVYDSSNNIIGYTDHLIAQNSDEFDGIPCYLTIAPDILPYYIYNKYVNLSDELEKADMAYMFADNFHFNSSEAIYENKWIEEESLGGLNLSDSHYRYFPLDYYPFSRGMCDYIKYYLESKLGTGNYFLDFSKKANFEFDKSNDTNLDPFHLAYLAINEYTKNAIFPEYELSTTSDTFSYLDKLIVDVKNVSGSPLSVGYNAFLGRGQERDINYFLFSDTDCDTPLTSVQMDGFDILGNGTFTDEGDYYKYSYTIGSSSTKLDGTNYIDFSFKADFNVSPLIELTFRNMKHQALLNIDSSDGTKGYGGWYSRWREPDNNHGYFLEEDCDDEGDGIYSYYFKMHLQEFIDDENVTIDIRLPKHCLEVSEKDYVEGEGEGHLLTEYFAAFEAKEIKELDDYYVFKCDFKGSSGPRLLAFDFLDGEIDFYFGNTFVRPMIDSRGFTGDLIEAPEGDTSTLNIQTDITNENVESLIHSNKFKAAKAQVFNMGGIGAIGFDAMKDGIIIVSKTFPVKVLKKGSSFDVSMNKLGDVLVGLHNISFSQNDTNTTNIGNFTVNSFSINSSNADISFKFKKGDIEESTPFNLPVDETNGATYDSITAYKKINTGEIVKIPDSDIKVEITSGNTKGAEGEEITLKVSGDSDNVTGSRTFSYKLGATEPNPPSPPGGGGGSGGGGSIVSSPKVTLTLIPGDDKLNKELTKKNEKELKKIKFTGNKVTSLPEKLERDGYIFDGWYKDKDFKEKVKVGDYLEGSVTLYAKWKEDKVNEDFKSYINGYDDGEFKPNRPLSRAEVATIISRLSEGFEEDKNYGEDSFPDTRKNFWYSNYIKFSQDNHLFEGYPDGEFKPERTITRGELAKVLVTFSKITLTEDEEKTKKEFTDIKENDFFKEYANVLLSKGLVKGYEDGSFKGNSPVTRAEAVTMINNILESLYGKVQVKETKLNFTDVKKTDWFYEDVLKASGK